MRLTRATSITILAVTGLLLACAAAPASAVEGVGDSGGDGLEPGLVSFLQARLLEAEGRYRDALDAYERALTDDPEVTEIRIGYANLLLRFGMADRAVTLLEGADDLDWHGRRIFALALAQVSVRQPERMAGAEQALRSVLEERDDDPNLLLALGQLLHRMNRIDEAEAVIAELQLSRPGSPQLVSYHAMLLRQLGRKQEAVELYASCAAASLTAEHCRDAAVELLIELDRPGEAADLMLATLDDDDLDQLMRVGYLLWEAGRPTQGLQVVNRVIRLVPDSERGRTLRAHLLSATGRYSEAADEFRALVKKNPADIELGLSLSWALARLGEVDEARRWLDRVWERVAADAGSSGAVRCAVTGARVELLADKPLLARGWLARIADPKQAGEDYVRLLGESYRREEDWSNGVGAMMRLQPALEGDARVVAEAVEVEFRLRTSDRRAWQRLRRLLDSDDVATVLMGIQVLQTVERWSEAEREAAAALERFPAQRDLLFARATSLERLDRLADAEQVFLRLLEADPDDATVANYLGYLWADRGVRLDEALELINRAVSADPENPAYLDSLGWVHFRLGNLEQAEYWLRRAIAIEDSDGTLHAHLGEVLLVRRQEEEASRFLHVALDLGCEDPDHVRGLLDGLSDAPDR